MGNIKHMEHMFNIKYNTYVNTAIANNNKENRT